MLTGKKTGREEKNPLMLRKSIENNPRKSFSVDTLTVHKKHTSKKCTASFFSSGKIYLIGV